MPDINNASRKYISLLIWIYVIVDIASHIVLLCGEKISGDRLPKRYPDISQDKEVVFNENKIKVKYGPRLWFF